MKTAGGGDSEREREREGGFRTLVCAFHSLKRAGGEEKRGVWNSLKEKEEGTNRSIW